MRVPDRGRQQRFAWALALCGAVGCARILGDDGIVITQKLQPETGVCDAGEFRCEGPALQICRGDGSSFRTAQVCSSAALCCAELGAGCARVGCGLPVCAAGDFRCAGTELSICNESLTGWERIDNCASPAQCNASLGRCMDQPCNATAQARDYQCNAESLEQCAGAGWQSVGSCETHALCTPGPAGPATPVCQPNGCRVGSSPTPSPFDCRNGDLLRCNDQHTGFEHVETCANAANCNALLDSDFDVVNDVQVLNEVQIERLGCVAPGCIPGTYSCDGADLKRCNPNRTAYLVVEQTCASAAHCNASAGRCEAEACTAGAYQCSGNELLTCSDQRVWQSLRECPEGTRCDSVAHACVDRVCRAGEYQCSDTQLSRCNVDGTGWIPVDECATAELCNATTKRCDPPVCDLGQARCSRDGKLQVCPLSRDHWQDDRDCRAEAQPPIELGSPLVSGTCDPVAGCLPEPSCAAGSQRCNGQFLERCEGNTWRPRQRCLTANLCDPSGVGSCRAATCQPGEHQCVTTGAVPTVAELDSPILGLTLQVCNTGGTGFETVRECTGMFCDAAHGQCDICDAYKPICNGDTLELCSADGQEREREKVCREGCTIATSDAGAPETTGQSACREDPPNRG